MDAGSLRNCQLIGAAVTVLVFLVAGIIAFTSPAASSALGKIGIASIVVGLAVALAGLLIRRIRR